MWCSFARDHAACARSRVLIASIALVLVATSVQRRRPGSWLVRHVDRGRSRRPTDRATRPSSHPPRRAPARQAAPTTSPTTTTVPVPTTTTRPASPYAVARLQQTFVDPTRRARRGTATRAQPAARSSPRSTTRRRACLRRRRRRLRPSPRPSHSSCSPTATRSMPPPTHRCSRISPPAATWSRHPTSRAPAPRIRVAPTGATRCSNQVTSRS